MEKKKVILTSDNGVEDIEVQKDYGRLSLRRIKIQRICQEAVEQEEVLSQVDLSKYLSSTVRTIQRDIREIKKSGSEIITRGYIQNIGSCQTHKVKITECIWTDRVAIQNLIPNKKVRYIEAVLGSG